MNREALILVVLLAFILDWLLGDPYWLPHPIRLIGKVVAKGEELLRKLLPQTKWGERLGGGLLVVIVSSSAYGLTWLLLNGLEQLSQTLAFIGQVWLCYQLLAFRSAKNESIKVYDALKAGEIETARQRVSMIVGRDTKNLNAEGITKATIETVAENASDGVIAPLFFMLIGGAPLGMLYKSINTMDSMLGYKNDRYQDFGWLAAKLDDVVNFFPARLAGLFMVTASYIGYDGKQAWRIFCRDRLQHASPNSAHTEAACAGALGIQLAGDTYYHGLIYSKPTLGDFNRKVEEQDILHANRLMYVSAVISLIVFSFIRWLVG